MTAQHTIPGWKDKVLFTPGPLTTSQTVKQAMLRDLGSRDSAFIDLVREIRRTLVHLCEASEETYTAVLMQGSGTFAIESVFSTTVPPEGKVLLIINGAYGRRMAQMTSILKIATTVLAYPETKRPNLAEIEAALRLDPTITHVAVVHCETSTGIFNPIQAIGEIVARHKRCYFVDAMSSFGGVPINLSQCHIDYLVSSANKCIEGVPGFAFVLARTEALLATEGFARSLSLDLLSQYQGLEGNGQFRFTPPTHALLAFHQALAELKREGGVAGRAARYQANHELTRSGMSALGFVPHLAPADQGYIITSFRYLAHPRFSFEEFYTRLNEKDYVIYPGKMSDADCFRIGHIGRIFPTDVRGLLAAVRATLEEMGIC